MKCELENNTVVVSGTEYIELFLPECIRQKETEYYMSLLFMFWLLSCLGAVSTLSRSHSIASAGDKSLVVSKTIDIDKNPDRIMQELQYTKK